ncbi:hypothetical protein [Streptomyces acidicola]|uniref:Uncharacterized protein n=1 Tax=Streptomyces acidicola TaxID=2596892 RepID=A0A5N8X7A7_9ACTN|nr:hypothetical protein [Streptomyces acidicola]MPY54908.1 hypothetical protein [Streptomyces acidicola]
MPGTVLLLAASPAGKACLVDAASVLPILAAVAPPVLAGTDTANVVELADPLEPQAVLTRLRAAAGAPGPLTIFLTGQLQLDRRQHLPHLALARTTPATVRYTAFPWHWLREELRLRPPGSTALIADLHADAETWQHLRTLSLDVGPGVTVHGRVAPPPPRRAVAQPSYMRAIATILRSGQRPPLPQLHHQALSRIASDGQGAYGDVVLSWEPAPGVGIPVPGGPVPRGPVPGGPVPGDGVPGGSAPGAPYRSAPPPPRTPPGQTGTTETRATAEPGAVPDPRDPHAAITAAVQAERHDEADALAARHEQDALRAHGPASEQALHWTEVRADLAMFAGDAARSCRTWMAVATARLSAGHAPDAPAVETAVDRAHHQWGRVDDVARARELGPALAELRHRVPGRREGALQHVQRHLEELRQDPREPRPAQHVPG